MGKLEENSNSSYFKYDTAKTLVKYFAREFNYSYSANKNKSTVCDQIQIMMVGEMSE